MSWVTPKTWWNRLNGDHINYTDVNRIKNNVLYLKESLFVGTSFGIKVIPEGREYFVFNISDENKDYYYQVNVTIKGNTSGQTYRYTYYFHGAGAHRYGQECPVVGAEDCRSSEMYSFYRAAYPFTIQPMFEDKAVNDLWYADEINTVLDNLETIAEHTSNLTFNGRPYYGDNSPVPTDTELNIIEGFTLNLYNRIYRDTPGINLGTEGSIGEPITNRLI